MLKSHSNMLDRALAALWNRPLFEREMARLYFKRASIMKHTPEFSKQYQVFENLATEIYYKYRPAHQGVSKLEERHFNDLVMFWSR